METLILCLVCIVVGWYAREVYAVHQTRLILNRIQTEFGNNEEDVKRIVIEKQDGIFFVYSKDDNSFMAQGSSIQELEANLAARYPGTRFGASNDNLKTVGIIK